MDFQSTIRQIDTEPADPAWIGFEHGEEANMFDPVTVIIDQDIIKFTPDGKIAVLDAIASLGADPDTPALWQHLLSLHPDLAGVCENYAFPDQPQVLVTNGDGWERIQTALFDFLVEMEAG